jgi:hypothetical protein
MGFVVDEIEVEQFFLSIFDFSLPNIITLFLIHLSPSFELCNSSDQAAHYQILGL